MFLSAIAANASGQPARDNPEPTAQSVTISGRVLADDTGDPLPNARVAVTVDAASVPVVLSNAEGRFTLSTPAGPHTIAAAIAQPPADGEDGWQDPEFLESLMPGASTVTLAEGERQILNLRLKSR